MRKHVKRLQYVSSSRKIEFLLYLALILLAVSVVFPLRYLVKIAYFQDVYAADFLKTAQAVAELERAVLNEESLVAKAGRLGSDIYLLSAETSHYKVDALLAGLSRNRLSPAVEELARIVEKDNLALKENLRLLVRGSPDASMEVLLQKYAALKRDLKQLSRVAAADFDAARAEASALIKKTISLLCALGLSVMLAGSLLFGKVKKMSRLIEIKSVTDELTGLYNRQALHKNLRQYLDIAVNFGKVFSVVILDIDHFKKVNDTYGHLTGDEVLKEVGRLFRQHARESDFPARYGGEEIVVILPGTRSRGACVFAEKMRGIVEEHVFKTHEGQDLRVTISMGVCQWEPGMDEAQVLACADKALYEAKTGGRNRVVCYNTT